MRIAQVSPLAEAVPPRLYGGTERIVSWLTEELVAMGHDVTLFASGDSVTKAKLVAGAPEALRLSGITDHVGHNLVMMDAVRRRAHEFDVIHVHVDVLPLAFFRDIAHKCVLTLHGRLDLPGNGRIYEAFPEMPLVSISDEQRRTMPPDANWLANVHHGMPPDLIPFSRNGGDYLAFLGRISQEKRPDRAIEIAKAAGVPLKIAAKVDRADRTYFEDEIRPLLDHPLIEMIGEINEVQKRDFLGNARALLFPIDWPEPFGVVMIEAMSAGTPIIAWKNGSVPEVVVDGQSGFIVESTEEAIAAVGRARTLDRSLVRAQFDACYRVDRMAQQYVAAYESLFTNAEVASEPLVLPPPGSPILAMASQRIRARGQGGAPEV